MRLAGVREGDIVQVDDGLAYFAVVHGRRGRRLLVAPLAGAWRPPPVRATDVVGHWRRAGPRPAKPRG